MNRHVLKAIAFLVVWISNAGTALQAHPGHALHDRYEPGHFLSDPYHLTITVLLAAAIFIAVRVARRYLKRA